jgi:hypothetical protein
MTASSPPAGNQVGWSGPVLLALVVSEYRKTLSTAAWWALLVPAALICGLVGLFTALAGRSTSTGPTMLAFALSHLGISTFAAIFGVVCSSAEFRHRTITTSHLVAAGRPQLLVAKAMFASVVGAGYALVCSVLGALGMLAGGGSLADNVGGTIGFVAVAVVVFALWAVLGVGLGTLLANQLGAIIGLLMYLLLVELVINVLAVLSGLGRIENYLPGGASAATLTTLASSSGTDVGGLFDATPLPWGVSLTIFFGYTLLIYAAGMAVAQARDIT